MSNAITWFEIPATNLSRAADFYGKVVDKELRRERMGESEMAVFPYERNTGIGGCIVSMEQLKPGSVGSVVYLYVGKDLDAALERVWDAGGKVALGKTALPGDLGHFAHIIDSEGNRVGLHAV